MMATQRWRIVDCKHCKAGRKCSWCNGYGKHPQIMTRTSKDKEWFYTREIAEAEIAKREVGK
jgi:hypothetical protein